MTVLALLGPTASGKSALARAVVEERRQRGLATEIVAVDAFTVYRGMDIGTAKPSAAERARTPHHLVDVLSPADEVTVAWFQRHARAAIGAVRARGATPLLVGGAGLYWRAVVDDLEFPPTDPQVRARIEARWGADAAGAHALLSMLDPSAAVRIDVANLRRTVRALEVIELTGEPFSSFRHAWDAYVSIYDDLRVALLDPPDTLLHRAIEQRAASMVTDGLLDEVARLRTQGPLSRTARQAIGYAEALAVLDGDAPRHGLAEAISRRTWRYARRQRAWFRADPRAVVAEAEEILGRWASDEG